MTTLFNSVITSPCEKKASPFIEGEKSQQVRKSLTILRELYDRVCIDQTRAVKEGVD